MKIRLKRIYHFVKRKWLIVLIIVAVLGVGYYFFFVRGKQEVESLSYTVKRQTIRETLSLTGEVMATGEATLAFQAAGKLAWVGVREGDTVKRGQAIASLDQRTLRKTLEKELNDYAKERLDFDQNRDDSREVVIGALNYDRRQGLLRAAEQAQYDLNNSVLDVELQTLTLELANLYSPIAGVVTHVGVDNAGVNILPAQATFQIINPDTLYFSATVDQTDVVKLLEGMSGEILFDSFPDAQVTGSITSIGFTPKADEAETVYEVKINMDNMPDIQKVRMGMTGDASFVVKEKQDSIAVPTNFVKSDDDGEYVWTKNASGKRVRTAIVTGDEVDIATEVVSGLNAGDVIYD